MSCATAPNYEAPFDGVWDNAGVFKEELIPAESKGRWGYADSMGTMVISPQFSEAKPFSGGKAAVRVHNKWGYIHRDGRLFIVPSFLDAGIFSDGRAAVRTAEGWGYIDDQGKMVIPADYDEAGSFSQGLAAVRLSQRWGYIDKKGKVAINFQFKQALAFSNDLAPAAEMKDDNEWGFIDTEGKFVIKPAFDGARPFADSVAAVSVDGAWGYIDTDGQFTVNPRFQDAGDFSSQRAPAKEDGLWGLIDEGGKFIVRPRWSELGNFSDALSRAVDTNGNITFIDPSAEATEFRGQLRHSQTTVGQTVGEERIDLRIQVRNFIDDRPVAGFAFTKAVGEFGEYEIPDPPKSGIDGVLSLSLERSRFEKSKILVGSSSLFYGMTLDVGDHKNTYTIQVLPLDQELPRIDAVTLNRENQNTKTNVLFQQEEFECKKPSPSRIEMAVFNPKDKFKITSYFLQQGNKRLSFSSPNFDVDMGNQFSVGDIIHAGITINYQNTVITLPTLVKIRQPAELDKPIQTLPVAPQATVPADVKLLAGLNGQFRIPGISARVSYENDKIGIYIGADGFVTNKELWKEKFKDWCNKIDKTKDYGKQILDYWKKIGEKPSAMGSGAWSGTVVSVGYIELTYKKGELRVISGGLKVIGRFGYEYTGYMMAGFIPLYASFGVSGELSVSFAYQGNDPTLAGFFKNITLTVTPGIDFEGGVGVKGLASAGVGVRAELPMKFKPIGTSGNFNADISVRLRLIFVFNFEYKIMALHKHLWGDDQVEELPPQIQANSEDFVMEDRGYLGTGSKWLGNTAPAQVVGDGPPMTVQAIKQNILPGTEPRLVYAVGKEFLFWIDDRESRAGADRAALTFSIRRADGSWEDPRIVNDDGTGDYDFDIIEHRGLLYAAWQNTTKKFGGEKAALGQVLGNSEILTAAYDPKSGNFGAPRHIDGPVEGQFFGKPRLASDGKTLTLTYVRNTAGDVVLQKGSTYIEYAKMSGTSWENAIYDLYFPNRPVIAYQPLIHDGRPYVITLEDEDGDFNTLNDRSIYRIYSDSSRPTPRQNENLGQLIVHKDRIVDPGTNATPRIISWRGKSALFYSSMEKGSVGNYYYYENIFASWPFKARKKILDANVYINEDFNVITGPDDKAAILFVQEDSSPGSDSILSVPTVIVWDPKGSRWSYPQAVWEKNPELGKRADAVQGFWAPSNRIDVIYRSRLASLKEDSRYTNLMFASIVPSPDLAVNPQSILRYYEPEVGGQLLHFDVEVVNQGLDTADGIVTDMLRAHVDETLGYGKAYQHLELRPGDRVILPMEYRIPLNAEPFQARVSVRPLKGTELYTKNNTVPVQFADPSLMFGTVDIFRKGFDRRVVAQAINNSPVRIHAVTLKYFDESNNDQEVFSQNLGTIMPNKTQGADLSFSIVDPKLDWSKGAVKVLRMELQSTDVLKGGIPGDKIVLLNPFSYPAFSLAVFDAKTAGSGYIWVSAAATNNHPVRRSGNLIIAIIENEQEKARYSTAISADGGQTVLANHLFRLEGDPRKQQVRVFMENTQTTLPGSPETGGLQEVGGDPEPAEVPVTISR
jgi:hypothetical protein